MPTTQYESDLTYPGGGPLDTVTISVSPHAKVANLEPNYITVGSSAFKRDGQFTFHTQADFEAFLDNLLEAANDAYEEPASSNSSGTVVINLELDTFDFNAELERVKKGLESAWGDRTTRNNDEFLSGTDDDGSPYRLAPELTADEWNRALETLVRTEHEVIQREDKTGENWKRVYADEKSSAALIELARTLTTSY